MGALGLLDCHADIDADQLLLHCVCSRPAGQSAYSRGTLESCEWCTGKTYQVTFELVTRWLSHSPDAACVDLGFLDELRALLGKRDAEISWVSGT